MVKKVSINLSEEQYQALKEIANQSSLSMTDYIIGNLPIPQENKLTLKLLEDKVAALPPRDFSLPELFSDEEWSSFVVGSRLSVAKSFNKKVKGRQIPSVSYKTKTSANLAIYTKR